jgi:hypothetical protein
MRWTVEAVKLEQLGIDGPGARDEEQAAAIDEPIKPLEDMK